MDLPVDLRQALNRELTAVSGKALSEWSANLSRRYRATVFLDAVVQTVEDVLSYAAFRMPATFAAAYSAMDQVRLERPEWKPYSMLDVGSGPGTVMWAADEVWPGLRELVLVERDEKMIALGRRLAGFAERYPLTEARWVQGDVTDGSWNVPSADLVTASYVLGELSPVRSRKVVEELWRATQGILLIIEPGTPRGYAGIMRARDQLREAGGFTVAPCPHDKTCPLVGQDWCHFSQRVARSRIHRQAKRGDRGFEDEKFSFVAVSRIVDRRRGGRIIRRPAIGKGHMRFDLCAFDGLQRVTVTKKAGADYQKARDMQWGSFWMGLNKNSDG